MGAGSSSTSVVASSPLISTRPANAICSVFRAHPVINKAFGSEKILVWKFLDHIGSHEVRLEHDIFTGRRLIVADGQMVYTKARQLLDTGSSHQFVVGSLKCSIQIVEQGLQFGYALSINEQPFARFRAEFWKYSVLWYLPRSGKLTGRRQRSGAWEEALGAQSPQSDDDHEPSPPASTSPSPEPSATNTTTQQQPSPPSTISRHHTVVVISHPQLTVLVNGKVVELTSAFSSSHDHEANLPEHESTTHSFLLPREASATGPAIACQLQVWLDKNDAPLAAGHVASHVPRDKKHGRYRYALRMDGVLVAQAPSPLVGLHGSLQNSAASSGSAPKSNQHARSNSSGVGFESNLLSPRPGSESPRSPAMSSGSSGSGIPYHPSRPAAASSMHAPINSLHTNASSTSPPPPSSSPMPLSDFGMFEVHAPVASAAGINSGASN